MKTKLRVGIVLTAVAGCACSVALAQPGNHNQRKSLKAHRVEHAAMAPEPSWIEYNGVRHANGPGSPTDDEFYIYQNGIGTTGHTAWFAASDPPDHFGWRALDDISFAGSYGAGPSGRTVDRLRFNITTTNLLLQAATTAVEVEVVLWKTLNVNGTPLVNTNADPTVFRVSVPAPAAGWALNTIYFQEADLTGFPGGGWATGGESFAIEFRYFQPGGTIANGLYHPDISVGFEGTGVENGTSADLYWADNNNGTPNGIMFEPGATGDALNFGGAAGNLANFAIGLRSNVTLPTGACCKIDGSCDATLNVQTCASIQGVYRGDGTTCATANCPTTGACCAGGSCAVITQQACTNRVGVYRGDGTCCATANCPIGFNTGVTCPSNNNGTNGQWIGFSSGSISGAPQRWIASPFTLSGAATVNGIDTDGFVPTPAGSSEFQFLHYIIWSRVPNPPNFPIGNAPVNNSEIVASGTYPFDSTLLVQEPRIVGTQAPGWLFHMTGLNIPLAAGNYWLTIYGDVPDTTGANNGGSVNTSGFTNWAWFANSQLDPAQGNTPIVNSSPTITGAYMWRAVTWSSGPGGFAAYHPATITVATGSTTGPAIQNPDYLWSSCFTIFTNPPPALCYPNCDHSTSAPCLNVLDFSCFLNSFAAGNCYANCDHSTTAPVLNVLDFSCFLNSFAAGCSNC